MESGQKKSLKKALEKYLIDHQSLVEKVDDKYFLEELSKKMQEATESYFSIMEIHAMIVEIYKDLLQKTKK
ncbi:MAG: hypothetical protein WC371_04460 [Parachlamydiales bacterium]|jgi:hypothetical protein